MRQGVIVVVVCLYLSHLGCCSRVHGDLPASCQKDTSKLTVDCTGARLDNLPLMKGPVRKLILADNRLTRIDAASLRFLPDLQYLDVSKNNLKSLDENLLSKRKAIHQMKVGNNPFECNCTLEWLRQVVIPGKTKKRKLVILDIRNITCSAPMTLKEKPLARLIDVILECESDLCKTKNQSCHKNAVCTITGGKYGCVCRPGYHGHECTDTNECETNLHGCSINAACTNTEGSHTCKCHSGYQGNGITCSLEKRSSLQKFVDHITDKERTAEILGITAAFAFVIVLIVLFFLFL